MKNGKYIENGIQHWYIDDKLYRTDGSAIIIQLGTQLVGFKVSYNGNVVVDYKYHFIFFYIFVNQSKLILGC